MKIAPQNHNRRSIRLKGYDYTRPGAYFVTLVTYHRDEILGEIVNGKVNLSVLGQIIHEEWLRSAGMRREIRLYEDEFVIMPNHLHGIVWIVADGDANTIPEGTGAGRGEDMGADATDMGARRAPQQDDAHSTGIVGADGIRPDGIHPDGIQPDDIRLDATPPNDVPGADTGARRAPLQNDAHSSGVVGADGIRPDGTRPDGIRPDTIYPDGIRPDANQPDKRSPARAPKSLGSFIAGFKASVTSRAKRELNIEGVWQRNYFDHVIRSEKGFLVIWNYIEANPRQWERDQLHHCAPPNRFNKEK